MAGDWLKVEHSTPDKPEVLSMASSLGISPDEVFGICFRMWRWFDQHTIDGNAAGVTFSVLDRCLGVPNFAKAALQVGWLVETESGLRQPNFDFHTGETAKQRALSAKRVKRLRKNKAAESEGKTCSAKCNAASVTRSSLLFSSLLSCNSIPEILLGDVFGASWDRWVAHRLEIKKPLKPTMAENQLKMLAGLGVERAVRMIDHTIAMGWQGLREPEENKKSGGLGKSHNQRVLESVLADMEGEDGN